MWQIDGRKQPQRSPIPLLGMVAKEDRMGFVGVIVTFAGFLLAAASVGISSTNGTRLGIVVVGIVISLIGIMGVLNPPTRRMPSGRSKCYLVMENMRMKTRIMTGVDRPIVNDPPTRDCRPAPSGAPAAAASRSAGSDHGRRHRGRGDAQAGDKAAGDPAGTITG
jgi:hypothetical protein